jgi:arginase family enzyme
MTHVATADTPMGAGISTFLSAPHIPAEAEAIRAHGAKAAFLGIPYEGANVYRYGQSGGPRAVRDATDQFFSYHYDYDVDLFDAYNLVDCGDVATVPADVAASHDAMRRATLEVLKGGALPLIQGGDHSIPMGTMKALSESTTGTMGLIQFDCHLDSSDVAFGTKLTGGSHLRRTSELPNVDPAKMVHIGSRGLWNLPDQVEYCKSAGIRVYRMRDVRKLGVERVVKEALEIAGDGTDVVALDVDLDVLDCPHAPGVCSPEPGGIHSSDLLEAIDLLGDSGRISLLEVVELAPIWDPSGLGARMACYVIFNLLGSNAKNVLMDEAR